MPDGRRVTDSRYSITIENTGAARPQYVARFCGDWIGARSTYGAALLLLAGEQARRNGALIFTEQAAP
jgi:hypothetical protein